MLPSERIGSSITPKNPKLKGVGMKVSAESIVGIQAILAILALSLIAVSALDPAATPADAATYRVVSENRQTHIRIGGYEYELEGVSGRHILHLPDGRA